MRGCFLTLEGSEGAGKSTHIGHMASFLKDQGLEVDKTREPGGTPLAEEIRELFRTPREEPVAPLTELCLMFAARAQHLATYIEPALASGRWVVCERFTDSTFAYQGGGRGLGDEPIEMLASLIHPQLWPDLTFYLDLPPHVGLERARGRGLLDRVEQGELHDFDGVRRVYRERAEAEPERFAIIDASQPLEAVQADLLNNLAQFCARRGAAGQSAP